MTDTAVIFDIIGRDKTSAAIAASGAAFNKFAIGLAAGAAFATAKFVDMAANFQQGMTRLKTGAGEVDSNMKTVSDGILTMAGQVGESTQDLLKGMYLIESAGYHGAEGLNVLKIAAEGAKVGNANMATVADAVTTALNAYHMGAGKATEATNALIAAEGQGKTNLEALSGSLSTVAPIASLAGVSLNELLGAMSTMTAQGTDAASAATYLKQTIGQLSNPTAKARSEMESLGLDATKVSMNLGKNGLASTLQMLTDAIQTKMGPAGTVLIDRLRSASNDTTKFQQILANLPPTQQTFIGALATMTGGTKSMQAALELTGKNMEVFKHNTDVINEKVKAGGNSIEGWADVQKNFNQRLAETKGTVEALGIRIGQGLLPYAQSFLGVIQSTVGWLSQHRTVAKALVDVMLLGTGAFVAWRLAAISANAATKAWMVATNIWKGLTLIAAAAQWVWNASLLGFPLTWILLAFAALVVAVILVIKYHKQIAEFFVFVWGKIWQFLKVIGAWFAGPFVNFFKKAGQDIAAPFLWLWHNIMVPVWAGITKVIQIYWQIISSIFNLWVWIIRNTLGVAILWLWHNVIEPAVAGIAAAALWLWHNAIEPAINGIAAAAMWLWHNAIDPMWHGIEAAVHGVADVAMWLWHNAIQPAFNGVAAAASWVWGVIRDAFNQVMGVVHAVGNTINSVFGAAAGFIKGAFNDVAGAVKGAINGVISAINGFINGVDSLVGALNAIPGVHFPRIPNIPHLAAGGTMLQSGLALVGERGPEIVSLPAGASVHPNGTVPAAGSGYVLEMRIKGGGDQEIGKLLHALKRKGILEFALVSELPK